MLNALSVFRSNIQRAREQGTLYDLLVSTVVTPANFDDLLRAQVIYSVSAFDKLLHDVIRIGMVETYTGGRTATAKYQAESITFAFYGSLMNATVPPAEVLFDQEVVRRLRFLTFQHPDNIADGLSLCWQQSHKWQAISRNMGITESDARTTLKLIAARRNAMVHEADIDPTTNTRTAISNDEANAITDFLEACGNSIVQLIK